MHIHYCSVWAYWCLQHEALLLMLILWVRGLHKCEHHATAIIAQIMIEKRAAISFQSNWTSNRKNTENTLDTEKQVILAMTLFLKYADVDICIQCSSNMDK